MPAHESMPADLPLPAGPAGVAWRRITSADRDAVHALAAAIAQQDDPGNPPGRPDLDQQLAAVDPAVLTAVESATSADRLYASIGFERVSTGIVHGLVP